MGLAFIDRTLRTTALVGLIFFPFFLTEFGLWTGLAWLSGVVWGGLNLAAIMSLVTSVLRPNRVDREKTAVISLIKFPLLYAAGIALLMTRQFSIPWLLAGSALPLTILLLKAVGRSLTSGEHSALASPAPTSRLVKS